MIEGVVIRLARCLMLSAGSQSTTLSSLPLAAHLLRASSSNSSSFESTAKESASSSSTDLPMQTPSAAPSSSNQFMSGARMIQRGTGRSSSPSFLHGIVHIHNSSNNIILTLTDLNGQVKACSSAGSVGFKNARKSLPAAAEKAAEELAKKALKLGFESARCHLKGVGNNKQYAVQSLATSGLRLTHLVETTSFPHNGCRMPKRRRI